MMLINNQPRKQAADRTYLPPTCEVILVKTEGSLCAGSTSAANEEVNEIDGEW